MDQLTVLQLAMQANQPIFLWGAPGTGKTANVESLARGLNLPVWTVILSTREPTDQAGLPVITEKGVKFHPPLWAAECAEAGGGVVFFDEFNTAPATVQASALRVVQGGYVGDLKLPEATSFVACGNPPSTSTGVYALTAATANRWIHMDWRDSHEEWCNGMLAGWPTAPVVRLPSSWRDLIQVKRATIVSFLRVRSNLRHMQPEDRSQQGKAWPSPRTWDMSARMLAAAGAAGFDERSTVAQLLLRGCVGDTAAHEFSRWFVNLDLRDPEEYLADPEGTPLPPRPDQVMATLDAVASAAIDQSARFDKTRTDRFYKAFRLLGRVSPDVGMPAARALIANAPKEVWKRPPPQVEMFLEPLKRAGIDFRVTR